MNTNQNDYHYFLCHDCALMNKNQNDYHYFFCHDCALWYYFDDFCRMIYNNNVDGGANFVQEQE